MPSIQTRMAIAAVIASGLAAPAYGQITAPAAAHRPQSQHQPVRRADSLASRATMMHDVGIGAAIGGFSGLLLGAFVATVEHANRVDFIVCAPQLQGFGCAAQRKAPTTPLYLAIGAAGGAILGGVMGAGYHQNRSP